MLQVPPSSFKLLPSFAKIVCEPGWKWPRREKPMANFDLFYVWSGEGELTLNGEPYPVGPGSCFLFRPGDYTSAVHNPQRPLVLTYIHFAIEGEPLDIPARYRELEETVEFENMLSRYVRLFLVRTFAAEEEAQLILKQMMIHLLRADRQPVLERKASNQLTEAIQEIANYIRQNPGISHRVEDLAGRAGLSPRYFSIKFKEIIGTPVQTYMIRTRIERAQHLLMHGGLNVTEVADALGYRDIFFFSRQFKQYTGRSPSEIR
ncbi:MULTISPECIES: AraC family transcriptional regulator [Paenibacillus]|uniref:AraC family transcriptional regulator n=1 Tax=Paenibacillus TaxID=44249 RepID=UPI00040F96CC|nr:MULTISPECIES: AraC family transcriptional regulator [Paenibacillus]